MFWLRTAAATFHFQLQSTQKGLHANVIDDDEVILGFSLFFVLNVCVVEAELYRKID